MIRLPPSRGNPVLNGSRWSALTAAQVLLRLHATNGRVVNEVFAEGKPTVLLLPLILFGPAFKLDRRIICEGNPGHQAFSFARGRVVRNSMRLS